MTSPNRRKQEDVIKLSMMDYPVVETGPLEYEVSFIGPKDTLYEGGEFTVKITLPMEYPFKSPSVGFVTSVYHPNVDLRSGSICLNVLTAHWSPLFDLFHIVSVFLPQLLQYPNANDPLNQEAGKLYIENRTQYNKNVKNYIKFPPGEKEAEKEAEKEEEEETYYSLSDNDDSPDDLFL